MDIVVHHAFNALLLVQHHACLTIGRFRGSEDIIANEVVLAREGISIFYTNRGGGLTYHGPGQLVVYPILSLKQNGIGIRHYIWKLEEVVIKMLANWDISGQRIRKYPGVWISDEKICSIGLRVTQGVTMHGFSINVCPNLQHFELIRPCGIIDKKMTSMCKLLGYEVKVEDIKESLLWAFSKVFGFRLEAEDMIKGSNLEAGH